MQRVFLSDLRNHVAIMFTEPRLMQTEKHLVSYHGLSQLWQGARLQGALDVVISVFIFDRAVKSAMEFRCWQKQYALEIFLADEYPDQAANLIVLSWVTVLGCSIHDMHGGLKWATMLYLSNKELMRDTWVLLQS